MTRKYHLVESIGELRRCQETKVKDFKCPKDFPLLFWFGPSTYFIYLKESALGAINAQKNLDVFLPLNLMLLADAENVIKGRIAFPQLIRHQTVKGDDHGKQS